MLEAFLVGIIDAFLLRKTMQFYSGVDTRSLTNGSALLLGVTPVISPVGPADDRWDAVDRVSCSAVISIGEDSEFRGNFLV